MAEYVGVQLCDDCGRYRACALFAEGTRLCKECLEAAARTIAAHPEHEVVGEPTIKS